MIINCSALAGQFLIEDWRKAMKVDLIAHTPEPEKLVAASAKLCYSKTGVEGLMTNLEDEKVNQFIDRLMALGHESPLEHMSFSFAVEGVSRVLTHQLVRHRIASYSQQSQRYVKLDQFEYVMPPSIESNEEARALFIETMTRDQAAYDDLVTILEKAEMEKLIHSGMDEEKAKRMAQKTAIEDARYVFPNACETKLMATFNARSLINFFEHRCCERAQWEIRALADEMLSLVKNVAPKVFEMTGPKCLKGPCPEGSMSCGKSKWVRDKYAQTVK